MTKRERLLQLARITALMRDQRLRDLHHAALERSAIKEDLKRLDAGAGGAALSGICAPVHARYEAWRAARRHALNIRLASATARWLDLRDAAADASGRDMALQRLVRSAADQERRSRDRRNCDAPG